MSVDGVVVGQHELVQDKNGADSLLRNVGEMSEDQIDLARKVITFETGKMAGVMSCMEKLEDPNIYTPVVNEEER